MALLPPRNVRLAPPTMPDAGGSVTFVFEAQSTGATTLLQATYTVPAPQPYVFENATGADPRTIVGDPKNVTGQPDDYAQELKLKKSPPGGPPRKNVRVDAAVVELDERKEPVPPVFNLTGRITIVP